MNNESCILNVGAVNHINDMFSLRFKVQQW